MLVAKQEGPVTTEVPVERKVQWSTIEEYRKHRENLVKARRQWLASWTEEQKMTKCINVPTPSQLRELKRFRKERSCEINAYNLAQLLYMCAELGLQRNGYERVYSSFEERIDGFFKIIQLTNPLMLDAAVCKRTFEIPGASYN